MEKYLWEIEKDKNDMPCKNKYTIVYENATYVYCKVGGMDELRQFSKEKIGKQNSNGSYLLTYDGNAVNKEFLDRQKQEAEIRKLKRDIGYRETSIDMANRTIQRSEKELAELQEKLKQYDI